MDETSSILSFSSSSSPATVTIGATTTNKRKPILIVNGYHFQMKNYNKTKTLKFWRCANRTCAVLLHTSPNDQFVRFSGNTTDHAYLPNPAASQIRTLREQMWQRAERNIAVASNCTVFRKSISVIHPSEMFDPYLGREISKISCNN